MCLEYIRFKCNNQPHTNTLTPHSLTIHRGDNHSWGDDNAGLEDAGWEYSDGDGGRVGASAKGGGRCGREDGAGGGTEGWIRRPRTTVRCCRITNLSQSVTRYCAK